MSSIEKKNNSCTICGKPSGTWTKCVSCRAKIYAERSRKKREVNGVTDSKDDKFYAYVWKVKSHFCEECGKELNEQKRWYMHHILPKAKFPYFRHDERNIIILCYQHHNEIESSISAPKMKVYEHCEKVKQKLLESVGMEYQSKITTP
jgi:hypothetical protein